MGTQQLPEDPCRQAPDQVFAVDQAGRYVVLGGEASVLEGDWRHLYDQPVRQPVLADIRPSAADRWYATGGRLRNPRPGGDPMAFSDVRGAMIIASHVVVDVRLVRLDDTR